MDFNQVVTLLGGFGVAFLVYLGTLSNNKNDATKVVIDSLEEQNKSLKEDINTLKQENKEREMTIEQLRKEIQELKFELMQLQGVKQ